MNLAVIKSDNNNKDNNKYVWVTCCKCGHKLLRVLNADGYTNKGIMFEIKCSSCKSINIF